MKKEAIKDGLHWLSGVGHATLKHDSNYWGDAEYDVDLFCIDGTTYGAVIDPDDGFRSYGYIEQMEEGVKCQYTFPPQKVIVKNEEINKAFENDGWEEYVHKEFMKILDATNGLEVLVVGTDYSEDYYPCAIFNYTPENLEINKKRESSISAVDHISKTIGDGGTLSYDVVFNDSTSSDSKGFKNTLTQCREYINRYNGTDYSYFGDYKGGTVSVVCNETGKTVFETEVK